MISIVIINKDESGLDDTLSVVTAQGAALGEQVEIIVVDASAGRLDYIRQRHSTAVRWLDFEQPPGVRITIPHQRNVGVHAAEGDIIVFTDAGCIPEDRWLKWMVSSFRSGEDAVTGTVQDTSGVTVYPNEYAGRIEATAEGSYLAECATINFAFRRTAFDAIGGFDERFAYGSDVDFTWRLNDAGYRVRHIPEAILRHDWGESRRQRRRSFVYGKARARLYRKHAARRKNILREDPVVVIYPLFLIGLPLTLIFPLYPLLLAIPAWRNRANGGFRVLVDHLWYAAGVLAELAGR
jgi:cellulose synthase/poly-beta-1,6-N-acetylglucosamine synthase-like glycosyltransferase